MKSTLDNAFRIVLIGSLIAVVCACKPASASAATVGSTAPEFTLTDTNGKQHNLNSYAGKTVVLEWLNHGCPFVKKHYGSGNMQALQKKYTAQGVVWLSIVSSAPGKQGYYSPARANQITADKGAAPSAVLRDPQGTVGRLYGAKTTPHMYVIDATSTLRYIGAIDSIASTDQEDIGDAQNYVASALDQIMAGKSVSKSYSTPYGCSVKY